MKAKIRYCLALLFLFFACSGAAPVAQDPPQLSIPQGWTLQSWTADPEVLTAVPKPHIAFILADDLGYNMTGFMGNRFASTPL